MSERSTTPIVMAHRGGRHGGDPNTVEAVNASLDAGAGSAEIDVNETSDGVLLATHDSVVSRNAWVSDHTFSELRAIDESEWGRRRLEDVVNATLARKAVAYLDLKSITPAGLKHVAQMWPDDVAAHRIVFASARGDVLAWVASNTPGAATSFLYYDPLVDLSSLAPFVSLTYVHPCFDFLREPFKTMTSEYVERACSLGYGIVSWSVNDADHIRRLAELGIDFVCTDEPENALRALGTPNME